MSAPDVIVYHNPDCGTSRNTLGLTRNAGIEPHVSEYLKTPPTRALLREKGTPFHESGIVSDEGPSIVSIFVPAHACSMSARAVAARPCRPPSA